MKDTHDMELEKEFPTEIFVPELHYPDKQYTVVASRGVVWQISPLNQNIIQIFLNPNFIRSLKSKGVSITITPKV